MMHLSLSLLGCLPLELSSHVVETPGHMEKPGIVVSANSHA